MGDDIVTYKYSKHILFTSTRLVKSLFLHFLAETNTGFSDGNNKKEKVK